MPGKGTVALAALAPCLAEAVSWFGERSCTRVPDGKEPSFSLPSRPDPGLPLDCHTGYFKGLLAGGVSSFCEEGAVRTI